MTTPTYKNKPTWNNVASIVNNNRDQLCTDYFNVINHPHVDNFFLGAMFERYCNESPLIHEIRRIEVQIALVKMKMHMDIVSAYGLSRQYMFPANGTKLEG